MRLAVGLASLILATAPIGVAPVANAGCDPQMSPIAGNISAITGAIPGDTDPSTVALSQDSQGNLTWTRVSEAPIPQGTGGGEQQQQEPAAAPAPAPSGSNEMQPGQFHLNGQEPGVIPK
jgi:hypothetical protein